MEYFLGGQVEPKQAVYLDSPSIASFRQILPFYSSGIFGPAETPLFLLLRPIIRAQISFFGVPKSLDVRRVKSSAAANLPIAPNGVVFYPYNSKSNIDVVSNRAIKHVLTLHGESNKSASNRPTARLYDYICIAGPLGRDRYLDAGIFSKAEVDDGRLVMMGDCFVQSIPWIQRATRHTTGALLYSPTWEGYGAGSNNYSSVKDQRGFHIAADAARACKISRIVVKPHPYLGWLQPRILKDFVNGVRMLKNEGFEVRLALDDANIPVSLLSRTLLADIGVQPETANAPLGVGLAVCDISGMEAVFLKQKIPHIVVANDTYIPKPIREIYSKKAVFLDSGVDLITRNYIDRSEEIDASHRAQVFGWQDSSLSTMNTVEQRNWLLNYVAANQFWRKARGL